MIPPELMATHSTSEILMIRPAIAQSNPQTQSSNSFQIDQDSVDLLSTIQAEFDNATQILRAAQVKVNIISDTPEPPTPDAMFPNNWFSTHPDSALVLYPMLAENRAAEAKPAPLEFLRHRYTNEIDLRNLPPLEGTGSLVLDRINNHAYVARSPRSTPETLARWAQTVGYGFTTFSAVDNAGQPIYHTNVMMAIGTSWATLVTASIPNSEDRLDLFEQLESREIIELTMPQLYAYAGNMIELKTTSGDTLIVLSETAHQSLTEDQIDRLSTHGKLLPIPIPTIEKIGGGSIRCMIAELF